MLEMVEGGLGQHTPRLDGDECAAHENIQKTCEGTGMELFLKRDQTKWGSEMCAFYLCDDEMIDVSVVIGWRDRQPNTLTAVCH